MTENTKPRVLTGNPCIDRVGRKKGSKNKITTLKLIAEESFRERNQAKLGEVLEVIVDQALKGCKSSQKLVWQSLVSNGNMEESQAAEKVQINIGSIKPEEPAEVVINPVVEEPLPFMSPTPPAIPEEYKSNGKD